jgi:hypothetical protein
MPSLQELVRASRFIFGGTVLALGASSVPAVRPKHKLITAHMDRSLRVNALLGDLRGSIITISVKTPESFRVGQSAVFFTNSWIHGKGIAVREVGHVGIEHQEDVAAEIAKLPQQHLTERLRLAALVVQAEIVAIDPPAPTFDQHAALWAKAHLRIDATLHGQHRHVAILYFPTAPWPPWDRKLRYALHQRGIFLLHKPSQKEVISSEPLPADGFVALDSADFQDEAEKGHIEHLLAGIR